MQFDKSQILDLLREQGNHDQADQADKELPSKVDPEKDSGLLAKFGIDPQTLITKFASGSGGGGLGGLLGR